MVLQASTSHLVTAVTLLSSVRLIVGDNTNVIFDVNDKEVVVGGGLAAIAEGGEQRRYRGTLGEVRRILDPPPCARFLGMLSAVLGAVAALALLAWAFLLYFSVKSFLIFSRSWSIAQGSSGTVLCVRSY